MSIPTDELRAHLARELDDLGPEPDLVREAAARGASVVRRRRALGGGSPRRRGRGRRRGRDRPVGRAATTLAPSRTCRSPRTRRAPPPAWDPLADGHVTRAEWKRVRVRGAQRRAAGQVRHRRPDRHATSTSRCTAPPAATRGSSSPSGRAGWHRSEDPLRYRQDQSCAAINQARELYSCQRGRVRRRLVRRSSTTDLLPPGNRSYAEGERVEIPPYDPDDIPEDWAFATELHLMNEGVSFRMRADELGWDELSGNDLAGITDQELLDAAQDPAFLAMVEVGVQWWYDEPRPEPVEINGELIPVMTGKGQQVPPTFP